MKVAWTSSGTVVTPTSEFGHEGMQVKLTCGQLVCMNIRRPTIGRSISGIHWVSWDGRDLVLAQGQSIVLHAGQALINGQGIFAFAPSLPQHSHKYMGALRGWMRDGLTAMQPSVLHIEIG